ncbi:hypothetical protein HIR49_11740, partial [Staphylococcus coagulans]|nr:hypothetical protein [Staphylococcus coagulans]
SQTRLAGRPGKHGTDATDEKVFVKTKANLRDIFFCLATEEQKIGLLRLNIAEKKHGRE